LSRRSRATHTLFAHRSRGLRAALSLTSLLIESRCGALHALLSTMLAPERLVLCALPKCRSVLPVLVVLALRSLLLAERSVSLRGNVHLSPSDEFTPVAGRLPRLIGG
jgi:hypothetical protein